MWRRSPFHVSTLLGFHSLQLREKKCDLLSCCLFFLSGSPGHLSIVPRRSGYTLHPSPGRNTVSYLTNTPVPVLYTVLIAGISTLGISPLRSYSMVSSPALVSIRGQEQACGDLWGPEFLPHRSLIDFQFVLQFSLLPLPRHEAHSSMRKFWLT